MADTPLGRGLIEIGANLAPLEKGLAEAQAKTRAALGGAAVGGGATTTGGATPIASQTESIKQQTAAINEATNATSNLNKVKAATTTRTLSVGQSLQQATKGFREFASSITGTIGAVTGVIGVFTLLTSGIRILMQKQEEQKRAQLEQIRAIENTRKEIKELNRVMAEGAEGILYQQTQLDRDLEALNKFYDTVKEKQSQQYKYEFDLIVKSTKDKAERNKKIEDLNAKSAADSEDRENRRNADIEKVTQDALKREASQRAEMLYENEVRAAQAAGDERRVIDIKAAEEKRKINEKIADMEAGYDRDLLTARLSIIDAERLAELKKIDERAQTEKDANKKIADEKRQAEERAAKAFAEAQRASFTQLQSQINSLFNTGNMEVGINRVAGLIQVLIDKTERG